MKSYIIFYVVLTFAYTVSPHLRERPPLPTTTTTTGTTETTTSTATTSTTEVTSTVTMTTPNSVDTTMVIRYKFEGVDYNDLPQALQDYHNDCYGQFIKCIRNRTDLAPVCAYNLYTADFNDFYGPCEVDLQNCYYRVKKGYGVYGTDYKNNILFYNGEGHGCVYYLRRAKTPEDMHRLYFVGPEWK